MFEENQSVNTMEAAEPLENNQEIQNTEEIEQVEPTQNANEEVVAPQVDNKPVQDAQTNALYAKIRREAEQKAEQRAKDQVIAEMYGNQGITTYEQYQKAIQEQQRQQQAQQMGVDPKFYNQFMQMQDKLNSIEREKSFMQQEQQFMSDPIKGPLYNQWKSDIQDLAGNYNVDLQTAFSILLTDRIGDILGQAQKNVQQETIKKLNNNATTSPGGLGSEATSTKQNISQMSSKDFKELVDKATRGEIKEF